MKTSRIGNILSALFSGAVLGAELATIYSCSTRTVIISAMAWGTIGIILGFYGSKQRA